MNRVSRAGVWIVALALIGAVCVSRPPRSQAADGQQVASVEQLKTAGVADFVHVRSNPIEVLTKWQDQMGVKK